MEFGKQPPITPGRPEFQHSYSHVGALGQNNDTIPALTTSFSHVGHWQLPREICNDRRRFLHKHPRCLCRASLAVNSYGSYYAAPSSDRARHSHHEKHLPNKLQCELYLPGIGARPQEFAHSTNWIAVRIKHIRFRIRCVVRLKVWMIQNVKELRSELDIEAFRHALDIVVFENREI
jgi:hypothetical protein